MHGRHFGFVKSSLQIAHSVSSDNDEHQTGIETDIDTVYNTLDAIKKTVKIGPCAISSIRSKITLYNCCNVFISSANETHLSRHELQNYTMNTTVQRTMNHCLRQHSACLPYKSHAGGGANHKSNQIFISNSICSKLETLSSFALRKSIFIISNVFTHMLLLLNTHMYLYMWVYMWKRELFGFLKKVRFYNY